ncbi:hypothetical protein EUX98_g7744 [Antrodiella citrinella]|uniref:Uncharacterized protein n=1 Tax=Antrodiella citrinella TaxID=2447956 RepID=A0A4S4MKT5_9APHY|nr:hypothetical protein EUX98_g7744 [Antrodiella citrinella]
MPVNKRLRLLSGGIPYNDPIPASPRTTSRKEHLKAKKKLKNKANLSAKLSSQKSETYGAMGFEAEDLRIATTGWSGVRLGRDRDVTLLFRKWESGEILDVIAHMQFVPFRNPHLTEGSFGAQPHTHIRDASARLFGVRTSMPKFMVQRVKPLGPKAVELVASTSMSEQSRKGNNRGRHYFSVFGADQNNKQAIVRTAYHRDNEAAFLRFWDANMQAISDHASSVVKLHHPDLAARIEHVNKRIEDRYGMKPEFGLFWNFCVNAPYPKAGVREVVCLPHLDSKNAAIMLCVVLVYYVGPSPPGNKEKVWLVFWEAGIVIQVPIGVMLTYPSALMVHFNVKIEDHHLVVTKNGERPTPLNSTPLHVTTEENPSSQRCSMVWFTQASIFQAAELAGGTVEATMQMEEEAQSRAPRKEPYFPVTYDAASALAANFFPVPS